MTKRILAMLFAGIMILSLAGCGSSEKTDEITKLSFKAASGYDYLKTLDGTRVAISGYMATSSPVDGSFMLGMTVAGARHGSQENGSAFRLPSAEQPFAFSGTAGPAGEKLPSVLHLYRSVYRSFWAPLFPLIDYRKRTQKSILSQIISLNFL